ncbi:unnamed protein product [Prunus armeniaca]|uniref:CRIB domain-containing protein n=1 Tax=Prunus armeniaca TaxID=36596 RepID=A0A6J5TD79_PRUAR|nr:unnamed protein product [Prunus armeniaca]
MRPLFALLDYMGTLGNTFHDVVENKHHFYQQLNFQLKVSEVHVQKHLSQQNGNQEEKDDEIQIGFPTDVKHVAHIGWEGPSANSTPSWMNDFKSSPEVSSAGQLAVKELSSQDMHKPGQQLVVHRSDIPRSRRHSPTDEPESSPTKKISDGPKKHSRRHRSKDGVMDSPSREAKEGSSRHSRRSRNSNNLGSESPSQDPPGIPKQRRKKGSSESGSARSSRRSSRSKGQNSMTDISLEGSEHGSKSGESPMHTVLAGEKGSEGFSGGNLN